MELFELIRQEYEFGAGTIKGVAEKLGVHRRAVRQALYGADPPDRKRPVRVRAILGPAVEFIDRILEDDRRAPRKQRHTAKRIWVRILEELPDCRPAASTVREYIRDRKREFAQSRRDVTIPQAYAPGEVAGARESSPGRGATGSPVSPSHPRSTRCICSVLATQSK